VFLNESIVGNSNIDQYKQDIDEVIERIEDRMLFVQTIKHQKTIYTQILLEFILGIKVAIICITKNIPDNTRDIYTQKFEKYLQQLTALYDKTERKENIQETNDT
jgi:hypothetical protein